MMLAEATGQLMCLECMISRNGDCFEIFLCWSLNRSKAWSGDDGPRSLLYSI